MVLVVEDDESSTIRSNLASRGYAFSGKDE